MSSANLPTSSSSGFHSRVSVGNGVLTFWRRTPLWLTRPMALVAALALVAGIYPADHWNHVTKLTTSNFESFITENVDAGKTAIVRWIASTG